MLDGRWQRRRPTTCYHYEGEPGAYGRVFSGVAACAGVFRCCRTSVRCLYQLSAFLLFSVSFFFFTLVFVSFEGRYICFFFFYDSYILRKNETEVFTLKLLSIDFFPLL